MSDRERRFDDTPWGAILRFWPIIVTLAGIFIFIYKEIVQHETRLCVVEMQLNTVTMSLDEVKGDVKILLSRRR